MAFREDLKTRIPWPALGKDWSFINSSGVVATRNQKHFVEVVIFAKQKLVLAYDGAEGLHNHPRFWEVSHLHKRTSVHAHFRYCYGHGQR